MRAIAIDGFGGPEILKLREIPDPEPAQGEILIRVVAAAVNPVDWKVREGWLNSRFPHAFPLIPGWDVAGTVEALGPGVTRFRKGQRVWAYARKPIVQWGTYAELLVLPEQQVGAMPSKLLFEEAACVPLAGLTAWQSLLVQGDVGPGRTVFVHAAAGGVGHFAVQLARQAGARVLGTARVVNHEFVLGMGAERVIDYSKEDFVEATRRICPEGVDVVLDAIGGETQRRSIEILAPGGRLVSIFRPPDPGGAPRTDVRTEFVFVSPNAGQLDALASLADRAALKVHVSRIYPLLQAAEAQRESQAGHVRGKLAIAI
jgi:NADPH2:quinone reductase